MALFPFLHRRAAAGAAPTPAEEVQRARTRARQRLIGAVVLLGIGIVGFPLLFETQPRPIPVDVTVEIPRKDTVAPLQLPSAGSRASGEVTAAPGVSPTAVAEAAAPIEPSPPTASAPATEAMAAASPPPAATAPAGKVPAAPPPGRAEPQASAAPTKVASPPVVATEGGARFVVQVGAFADPGAAQRTRERVERLGLKTYTQVVTTPAGERTRVRVGPFASRDEADRAAARLQSAGLAPAVLTL